MKAYVARIFLCLLTCALAGGLAAARTIEFETTEVTAADVTVSPDGQWLIFTMLGHLFRLPVEGGTAEQLTFGPYYDTDPVFSPDGSRLAFVSDRDGSEGNIFVLELATSRITQVTRKSHARWIRLTWTPDGQAIVYLPFTGKVPGWNELPPALVRRVSLDGGEPETLSAPARLFRSVFYLPDGRLAWTVVEREGPNSTHTTRIEVMSPEGVVSTVRTMSGYADRAVPSPAGDGLYWRHRLSGAGAVGSEAKNLLFVPLPGGAPRRIIVLSHHIYFNEPQFAVAADNKSLYIGQDGHLWKIALPSGGREHLAFRARVRLDIQAPTPPPQWAPAALGSSAPPRSVLWPRLSPDGRSLVFGAAGYLWQQSLDSARDKQHDGGQAQRLFAGSALEREPAFSPDGRQLAFVRRQVGKDDEVRVFNFDSRQTRTVVSGPLLWDPNWSPDGQRLVFMEQDPTPGRVVAVDLSDGKREALAVDGSRPHFSADGRSVYYSGPPSPGRLYRLPLEEAARPEAITQVTRVLRQALVSPDGKWLAYRRNTEISVAPLDREPVKEEDVRQLSSEGGNNFAFTPDGAAVIYAAGNRVWQQPIAEGEREEIPIRLELPRPTPPPLLVRRVRVLDFDAGGFGPETSLFIEQGRIRWMGSERDHELPQETVALDAGGRFAIPGLFDMHVHSYWFDQVAFLAYGVTSVRDVGAWVAWLNALADRSEATNQPVPRYFFAGDIFHGRFIDDEDDARTYVHRWKERGAHFIKAYPDLSWPLHRVVAEEARRLGLPVAGHGDSPERVTKSVTLGYASLEHTVYGRRLYDDVLQMLVLAGTRWDPTLTVRGGNALLVHDEPERLADAKLRAFAPEWRIREAQASRSMKDVGEGMRGYWVKRLASIGAAHRRGVKLLTGTDVLPSRTRFLGSSLHWELEHFVQAGIPPLDVLRIATQEGAAAVGAEDDLGTLEPGKLADIVLLDKNPLEDIKNTQTIWRVIKGGWLFDPEKLRPPKSGSDDECEKAARALKAVDAFLTTWNSRDPKAWANSLNYPHTRQSPTRGRVWQTREAFIPAVDFERVLRTGWHHTQWDRKEVIHSSRRKAHVAGQYTRYNAQGEKLLTNQVTYVATEVDGKWGIQARFAAGPPVPEAERTKNEAAALKAVRDYMDALNSRDRKACAATLNYPHVRIASGSLRVWETAKGYAGWMDFDQFIRETGWHHNNLDSMRAIQTSTKGVIFSLVYTRYDAKGKKIATYEALYFVTNQDGHWGVRARSSSKQRKKKSASTGGVQ